MANLAMDFLNTIGGVAQGIASPFEYLGQNAIVDPIKQLADEVTGNNQAYASKTMQQQNQDLGLGAKGTNLAGGLEKLGGNVAQVGLDVVAPGIIGSATKVRWFSGYCGYGGWQDSPRCCNKGAVGGATVGGLIMSLLE